MEDNKVDVELDKEKKSYAGIPEAYFVEDVNAFMAKPENESADKVLQMLDENHGKYKFMEFNLVNKRKRLKEQIPDLERSLEMIKKLQSEKDKNRELETQFLLSEQVYAKAVIPVTDKVCLWLGANVMLEYTLDDAQDVLTKNLEAAKKNLSYVEHDLNFVRDQYTTTEVTMARIYNWEVKRRQAAKPTWKLFLYTNLICMQRLPKAYQDPYTVKKNACERKALSENVSWTYNSIALQLQARYTNIYVYRHKYI